MPSNPNRRSSINRRRRLQNHNDHVGGGGKPFLTLSTLLRVMIASYLIFLAWVQSPVLRHVLQQTASVESDVNLTERRKLYHYQKSQDDDTFLPRILAIVFPQFHSDPLNNRLWGEGFSDWNNLRAAPSHNRLGYRIPRPADLGYYNLTDTEPRRRQGELAHQYGIDGFIYHHYWFYDPKHPGPTLHAPLEAMLKDGHPNLPFALHWCATKWTNTWSGAVRKDFIFEQPGVLQKQYFPADNDTAIQEHYQWLRKFFHHPNYIKVDGGKPLFMVYQKKPGSFAVLDRLRQFAQEDGFPDLYLTVGLTMPHSHLMELDPTKKYDPPPQAFTQVIQKRFQRPLAYPHPATFNINRTLEIPQWCLDPNLPNQPRVPDIAGIIPSFDNTPRRNYDQANIWSPGEPQVVVKRFQHSLEAALYYEACCFPDEEQHRRYDDDRFVVINAMNEWAEGMALEPSDVYGRTFLEAIQAAKQRVRLSQCHVESLIA